MPSLLTLHALLHTLTTPPRALALFAVSPTLAHLGRLSPAPPSPLLHLSAPTLPTLITLFRLIEHIAEHAPRLLANLSTLLFTSPSLRAVRALRPLLPSLHPRLPHLTLLAVPAALPSPCASARFQRAAAPAAFLALRARAHVVAPRRAASAVDVPAALVDARLPPELEARLHHWCPRTASDILSSFALITTPTHSHVQRFGPFCSADTHVRKAASPAFLRAPTARALPAPPAAHVSRAWARRPVWMAVTEGRADEVVALKAHAGIRGREGLRNALLIVAPSQPTRGARIRRAATKADFGREEVLCAAEGAENPTESAAVYVADGPVGAESFYEYAPVVLVGDSFAKGGKGSSFTPAAHYACCVIHGPWYDDFRHLVTAAVNEIMRQGFLRPREMRGAEDEMWKEPCMEALDEEDVVELVAAALTNKDRTTLLGSALQKAAVHLEKAAGDDAIHLVDDLMRLAAISAG